MKIPFVIAWFLAFLVVFALFPNRTNWISRLTTREGMVNKKCPDGTRSDGPCLLEFPTS